MGGTQPLFDMSKAQPIQSAPLFDMSKAKPIAASEAEQPSAFQRLVGNGLTGAGVMTNEQGKNFFVHPVDTLKAMANLQGELGARAGRELENKDYVRGLTHGVEWLLPGLGPTLAKSGDQLEAGDYAGGIGTTLGAAATLLAGSKMAPKGSIAEPGAPGTPAVVPIEGAAPSTTVQVATAPIRAGARALEAVANSKLKPFAKVMTPADEAAALRVKVPGRDFGLPQPVEPAPATIPGAPVPVASPESRLPAAFQSLAAKATPPVGTVDNPFRPTPRPGAAGNLAESVTEPQPEPTPEPSTPPSSPGLPPRGEYPGGGSPRVLSGESALRQILTGQDNKNLMKIAKSRGISTSQEAQLKPSVADPRLVTKIIDDFDDDELDGIRSSYMENTQMGRHNFGDIGAEAQKTLAMQTYFPDVKVPAATMIRTKAAIANAPVTGQAPVKAPIGDLSAALKAKTVKPTAAVPAPLDDLTQILQDSLKRIQEQKQSQ
jgi:hypothetical protein